MAPFSRVRWQWLWQKEWLPARGIDPKRQGKVCRVPIEARGITRQATHQQQQIPRAILSRLPRKEVPQEADEVLGTLEVNLEKFTSAVRRGRERLQGKSEDVDGGPFISDDSDSYRD